MSHWLNYTLSCQDADFNVTGNLAQLSCCLTEDVRNGESTCPDWIKWFCSSRMGSGSVWISQTHEWSHWVCSYPQKTSWTEGWLNGGLAEQRVSWMEGLLNRGLAEPSSRAFTTWRQAGLTPYGVQGSEAFLKTYDLTTRVTSETRKRENIIRKSILGLQFRGPPHTLRLCLGPLFILV